MSGVVGELTVDVARRCWGMCRSSLRRSGRCRSLAVVLGAEDSLMAVAVGMGRRYCRQGRMRLRTGNRDAEGLPWGRLVVVDVRIVVLRLDVAVEVR